MVAPGTPPAIQRNSLRSAICKIIVLLQRKCKRALASYAPSCIRKSLPLRLAILG